MDIIRYKYIFFTLSGALAAISIAGFVMWGLKLGIDFTGGSLLEVEFLAVRPRVEEIHRGLEPLGLGGVIIQPAGEKGLIMRFGHVDEDTHQRILGALSSLGSGDKSAILEKRFDAIGPTIGAELKYRAMGATALAICAIIVYIAWAFRRVSRPVQSWKYGIAAFVALIHDVAIPVGVFAFLGHFRGVEIDPLFITAILTVLGFSVHDTIVVFDRIRENLERLKTAEPFAVTVNRSVNETLVRSLMTSLTVILVLSAVLFFGGESTRYFNIALIIGITFGTYSSIFMASPLLVAWHDWTKNK